MNCGIAEVFGEPFAQPYRQPLKIEVHDGVGVLVIDDFVGVVGFNVGAHGDVVACFAGSKNSRGVHSPLHLPIGGQQQFQSVFVFYREDDQRFAQVDTEFRKGVVKDLAELFELVGNFSRLVFPGVADHLEVRRLHLNPCVLCQDAGWATGNDCRECKTQ